MKPNAIKRDTSTQSWISNVRGFHVGPCFSLVSDAGAEGASIAGLDNLIPALRCQDGTKGE
jgi:hypothetical protein